ncbi:MAG: hypothetical protein IPO57_00985 [Rhodocyclales bacterium]|nr:hypothetical protein [Rhodocyclales bacterium]
MFKETASLLTPLALSVALHAGGFAFLQAHYGAPPGDRPDAARRPLALRVTTLEAKLVSSFSAAAEVSPALRRHLSRKPCPRARLPCRGCIIFRPRISAGSRRP